MVQRSRYPSSQGTLSSQIHDDLLARIGRGEFNPGDRLPGEATFMAEYQVGRNTLREAVQGLVALGLLEVRPRRGAIVLAATPQQLFPTRVLAALLDTKSVMDLYDVRLVLETHAAGKAATNPEPGDIELIDDALAQFRLAHAAGAPVWEADLRFHQAIAIASQNSVVPRLLLTTHSLLAEARRATEAVPGAVERAIIEHAEIARAIKSGDVAGARQAMTRHIESAIWAASQVTVH